MSSRRWVAVFTGLALLGGVLTSSATAQVPREAEPACPADVVPRAPFEDRSPTHGPAIDCLHWYGFTEGVTADLYAPERQTTRGQLSSLLVRVLTALDGVVLPPAAVGAFPDVADSPHADAIEVLAAVEPPVLNGYRDGTFRPGLPVTRAQLASVLVRADDMLAAQVHGYEALPDGDVSFPDVTDDPHREAVERLAGAGIITGYADGTFGPGAHANRGHVAALLGRWLDRLATADLLAPPTTPPPVPDANVGAASRSVLPLVDGARDYLDPAGLPGPMDATSVGAFVPEWDAGTIDVGNGEPDAHWVRDDLRASAVAIEDRSTGEIAVLVSADLYMLFNADVREIRERALAELPAAVAERTEIAVMTTHNHHGPDTAWNANHEWFEHMMDEVAAAAVAAVTDRRPATLRVAEGEHWFGMGDTRDAQVIDPTMNVLQATALDGDVIATVVQWNNHPEVTLGWDPPDDRSADCAVLGDTECNVEDRYFTADYPGHLRRTIEAEVGGEVVYFVGALGGLVAPLRVPLWEVDDVGLGDQYTPPPGAVPAGGTQFATFTEANFRRAAVIGEQAALAALRFLRTGEELDGPVDVDHRSRDVYTRLSNIGFRVLLVRGEDGRTSLGHTPAPLFTCPALGPKDATTCAPDDFATEEDPQAGAIRRGDHGRTEVAYLRVGPVGMVLMPGEVVGELANGLPAGFDDDAAKWFESSLDLHADGPEYAIPGYVRAQMPDRYRWTIGMGNDEIGYIVPISDWRIACPLDAETCADLHESGVLAYPDSASGEQCKAVTEDPSLLEAYGAFEGAVLAGTCRYGQAVGEATSHYEETMAAGWDTAADMLAAVRELTGGTSTERINPAFEGYWRDLPPPTG